ncbi:hypothetical protein PhCBS80983_g04515 [Powellomyces hirtus]|uniref:Mitochondrial carrier protein n=1 Tax=Powellomyces hirtus TaxID=109895 RepID=A0A507DZV6_9FUNG|nr:hypothetical protein PhCBS80983_g04515 [Powellomyces hirtus]
MASPLAGVAVINSLLFGVYGFFLRHIGSGEDSVLSIAAAGSASGFVNAFFSFMLFPPHLAVLWNSLCYLTNEIVKIRLQNQREKAIPKPGVPIYKGPLDCVKQIYRTAGIRGYYRGLGCTLIRETPSYGAYFASYEMLCRMLVPEGDTNGQPSPTLLFAGGLAGVIAWLSTYPFDVIKTRLQSVENEVNPRYRNTLHCFKSIVRTEGWRVLFSGWGATAIRAFPTNAATFYAVSWTKNALTGIFDD